MTRPVTKIILVGVGSVSVALGVVGAFVPLLPTTPFLLLAAACYARSSEYLHTWLLNNKRLGPYVRGYVTGSGIPLRAKVLTLLVMWGSMGYCVIWLVPLIWVKVALLLVACAVTVFILSRKTLVSAVDAEAATAKVDDPHTNG